MAFTFAIVAFFALSRLTERLFMQRPFDGEDHGLWTNKTFWTVLQWSSTGFLWSQWLTQDLVNIMVYLGHPDQVGAGTLRLAAGHVARHVGLHLYRRGGKIRKSCG